jgi:hypothetical protein
MAGQSIRIIICFRGGRVSGHYVQDGETLTVTSRSGHQKTSEIGPKDPEILAKTLLTQLRQAGQAF